MQTESIYIANIILCNAQETRVSKIRQNSRLNRVLRLSLAMIMHENIKYHAPIVYESEKIVMRRESGIAVNRTIISVAECEPWG